VNRTQRPARWHRTVLWALVLLMGALAVVVVGVAALLHSQRFHNYALMKARQSVGEALGVQVELQNYALHFSGISPTLDMYGLVVHGAAPYSDTPLLQVEHARIGVRIVSLLKQKWYLSEVTIHHGVAQVKVDAKGNNNLPKPGSSSTSSNGIQPLFDLAIRNAALDKGEIYYNDLKLELDGDVRELMLNAGFDPARNDYRGQVAYSDGHLMASGYVYEPIPHALTCARLSCAARLRRLHFPRRWTISTTHGWPLTITLQSMQMRYGG
jgi:translocation and assembly module TamB